MIGLIISLMLLASPAAAFVERLHPGASDGRGIPCHIMGGMIKHFVEPGGPSAAELGNVMQRNFLCGEDKVCQAGEGWTAQDNTDNSALIAAINAKATLAEKRTYATFVESMCIFWESGVDVVDTAAKFRTRIGIAP